MKLHIPPSTALDPAKPDDAAEIRLLRRRLAVALAFTAAVAVGYAVWMARTYGVADMIRTYGISAAGVAAITVTRLPWRFRAVVVALVAGWLWTR